MQEICNSNALAMKLRLSCINPSFILDWHYFWFPSMIHDDVIKWKHFPRNWPFVRGIHRSPVNSLHKGQWRGALVFSLICVWINGWVNTGETGDLRRYLVHCDVTVMYIGNCDAHVQHWENDSCFQNAYICDTKPRWVNTQHITPFYPFTIVETTVKPPV